MTVSLPAGNHDERNGDSGTIDLKSKLQSQSSHRDERCHIVPQKKSLPSHLLYIDAELLRQSMDAQHRSAEEMRKLAREMREQAVKMRVESESARRITDN
jgi:hypothetical protein